MPRRRRGNGSAAAELAACLYVESSYNKFVKFVFLYGDQSGGKEMALVRVRRAAQITLPAEIREKLGVSEGDYLEAKVTDEGVLLKPVSVVERKKAWERVFRAMESVEYVGPEPEPGEDEVMEMVVEEIHAMRREHEEKSRSR